MMDLLRRAAAGCAALALAAPGAWAQADLGVVTDLAGIVANDEIGAHMAAYCDERSPAQAAAVRAAWRDWRQRFAVPAARAQIEQAAPGAVPRRAGLREALHARMAQEGPPDAVCAGVARSWSGAAMDMRSRHPRAYDAQGQVVALQRTPPAAGGSPAEAGAAASPDTDTGRPTGTWLSPAQITAMARRGFDARPSQDRLKAAGLDGRLFVRGQVVERGGSHFIEHVDGPMRSRLSVSTGLDLAAHVGRTVVVSGTLEELPTSLVFLRRARLVADPSALLPSREPLEPGLVRAAVEPEAVRAAPGRGVALAQVQGVFLSIESGATYRERAWLLLRDGTLYDRTDLPPADLDLAASRQKEPQRWGRWRAAGEGRIEWQPQDDFGRPAGEWRSASGRLLGGWTADARLDGRFTAKRFYGDLTFGGTYASNTLRFDRGGRFEASNFSQSGSGAVPAEQGVTVGSARHSDASGTRSSTGGAAPGVAVATHTRRDDGAEQRGSYRLDGYTLELRYDSGRIERVFSFPVPRTPPALFVRDMVFAPPARD